jgi:hypothetical protein
MPEWPRAHTEWEVQMNSMSPWLRGPNLALAVIALALVVLFLIAEHVYEWPFPTQRRAR